MIANDRGSLAESVYLKFVHIGLDNNNVLVSWEVAPQIFMGKELCSWKFHLVIGT